MTAPSVSHKVAGAYNGQGRIGFWLCGIVGAWPSERLSLSDMPLSPTRYAHRIWIINSIRNVPMIPIVASAADVVPTPADQTADLMAAFFGSLSPNTVEA
jgi:hypothetical protein